MKMELVLLAVPVSLESSAEPTNRDFVMLPKLKFYVPLERGFISSPWHIYLA